MRILFLAPQPFFQERGTPIAVRLALQVLGARGGDDIDLLTYHEGEDISLPRVTNYRISAPRCLSGIGPGVSIKKILCDFIFLFAALKLVMVSSSTRRYSMVHAVEEGVFVALLIKWMFGIPYIYDMDSSLAMQLTEKWQWLAPLRVVLEWFEKIAIRQSIAVVPVCDALAAIAHKHGSVETKVLNDISLLDAECDLNSVDLKKEADVPGNATVALYIGNLESYQGIDLLIESVASVKQEMSGYYIVIIGGRNDHIEKYKTKAKSLGVEDEFKFIGPRLVSTLSAYLSQADILLSPRTKGNNTPMKIYSYLHSGKAILATDLYTHTQVLNSSIAVLAGTEPQAFGAALLSLFRSSDMRNVIGHAARLEAEKKYTFEVFSRTLNSIYEKLERSPTVMSGIFP